jgi:nucleotide-binding universal stress UspA family protein
MGSKTEYMGPLSNILLASDGSEYSEGAVKEAVYLAKSCDARLYAVYVLETNPEFETEGQKHMEKMEENAREHIDSVRKRAAQENVEFNAILRRTDQPHKAIIEEAEKLKADVIVMGRRGKTGLKKVLMGSVTASVIAKGRSNVLVVPKEARIDCKRIMAATDGSINGNLAVFRAIDIAKRCKSALYIVSVIPSQSSGFDPDTGYSQRQIEKISDEMVQAIKKSIEQAKKAAGEEGVETESLIHTGIPHQVLVSAAREKDVDLLVIGSPGRSGVERLITGSVAAKVVGKAGCSVLTVKKAG